MKVFLIFYFFLGAVLFHKTDARKCACAKANVQIRTSPRNRSPLRGTLTKDSCLTFKRKKQTWGGTWVKVDYNSKVGWIKHNHLDIKPCLSATDQCACASTNVNIRSGAGTSNAKIGLLKTGSCAPFNGNKISVGGHDWAHVNYEQKDGFIAAKYLSFGACNGAAGNLQCACGTGNVYIRSGASTSNDILGTLKQGACVPYKGNEVRVGKTRWAMVDYNGQNGFVSARYLSIRLCGGQTAINQCVCGTTNVNIRNGASTQNSILGTLRKGTCAPYMGDQIPVGNYRWAHVEYLGTDGFIASNYLTFGLCAGSTNSAQCACGTSNVNIRSGASTTSDVLGSLESGACVPFKGDEVFAGSLRWAHVSYQGKDGYVASKFLIFTPCQTSPESLL